jgi:hypothetical protein
MNINGHYRSDPEFRDFSVSHHIVGHARDEKRRFISSVHVDHAQVHARVSCKLCEHVPNRDAHRDFGRSDPTVL